VYEVVTKQRNAFHLSMMMRCILHSQMYLVQYRINTWSREEYLVRYEQVQYEVLILEALPHDTTTRPIKRLICSVSLTVWFNAVWMYLTTKNGSSFMMSVSQPAPKIDH